MGRGTSSRPATWRPRCTAPSPKRVRGSVSPRRQLRSRSAGRWSPLSCRWLATCGSPEHRKRSSGSCRRPPRAPRGFRLTRIDESTSTETEVYEPRSVVLAGHGARVREAAGEEVAGSPSPQPDALVNAGLCPDHNGGRDIRLVASARKAGVVRGGDEAGRGVDPDRRLGLARLIWLVSTGTVEKLVASAPHMGLGCGIGVPRWRLVV